MHHIEIEKKRKDYIKLQNMPVNSYAIAKRTAEDCITNMGDLIYRGGLNHASIVNLTRDNCHYAGLEKNRIRVEVLPKGTKINITVGE